MVRALFAVAGCMQPAVIFIDEIDSVLSARKSEGEAHTSSIELWNSCAAFRALLEVCAQAAPLGSSLT